MSNVKKHAPRTPDEQTIVEVEIGYAHAYFTKHETEYQLTNFIDNYEHEKISRSTRVRRAAETLIRKNNATDVVDEDGKLIAQLRVTESYAKEI